MILHVAVKSGALHNYVSLSVISKILIFALPPEPIRGADIIATTTFPVVPGRQLNYKWEGHGLELSIPEDALDPGTPSVTMSIQASLSGQYQLPDNTELVSGIYWITSSQKISLKTPATLKLQHCACVKHPKHLTPNSVTFGVHFVPQ